MSKNKKSHCDGFKQAVLDYKQNRFDIEVTLHGFTAAPPQTDFEQGYVDALMGIKKFGVPVHREENVVYVGWNIGLSK